MNIFWMNERRKILNHYKKYEKTKLHENKKKIVYKSDV